MRRNQFNINIEMLREANENRINGETYLFKNKV